MLKVILAFLFFPASSLASESLSSLISDARVLSLDSASTTRQRFSDAQITTWLNIAQRQATQAGHCLQNDSVFKTVVGQQYYSLPSNFLSIVRVTMGNKWLLQMTPASLDGRTRQWETVTGYPTYFFVDYSSRTMIGFAPYPNVSTDTDSAKVEFNIQPTDMVNGTDLPFNGVSELQDYGPMLPYYAASIMSALNDQNTISQTYAGVYTNAVKAMVDRCVEKPSYMPSSAGVQ